MAKNILTNGGEDIQSRTNGELLITVLGKSLTNKHVDIYSNLITTRDPVNLPLDNLSSGQYDYTTVRTNDGGIVGRAQGDEQEPAGEISFSFLEDYIYVNDNYIYGNSKNKLISMLNGEAFRNGEDVIVPIGTNGTDKTNKTKARKNEMNLDYKYLFHNEAGLIKVTGGADPLTGAPTFRINPFQYSFNATHKTFCMEFRTLSSSGKDVTRMLAVVAKQTASWSEEDLNKLEFSGERGCDLFERSNFMIEGAESADDVNSANVTRELEVDYIVTHGQTEPADAVEGSTLVLLGNDGTVTLKKKSSSAWSPDAPTQQKFQTGTRIFSRKLITADTITVTLNENLGKSSMESRSVLPKAVNTFVVIRPDGKAVRFSTDASVPKFYAVVYTFDRNVGEFRTYASE